MTAARRAKSGPGPRVPSLPDAPDFSAARCATCPPGQRHLWTSEDHADRLAARNLCRTCPVLAGCRTWALSLPAYADSAIYAGMTGAERLAAKRAAVKRQAS